MMNDRERLVYTEQVKIVFSQTTTAAVGGAAISAVFVWIFWSVTDHAILLVWLAGSILISGIRLLFFGAFLRRDPDEERIRYWGNGFVLVTFLQGSLWGAAESIFIPVEDPIYTVIVAMWIVGLSAASVGAYSAHLKVLLAFFIPVVLPGTIHLFLIGGQLNTALGIAICVYALVMMRATIPINRSMIDAIKLNFDLEREIEERKNIERKLREISTKDGLTGLSSRRHFDEVLENEIRRAQRSSHPLSLILLDVDYFKAFNDTYGHLEGDACLQRISRSIEKIINRPGDLASRYGGEEFVVILPNTDADSAYEIAEAIRKAVQRLEIPHVGSKLIGPKLVTISAGVSTVEPAIGTAPSDIIRPADSALYQAKAAGRNRIIMDCRRSGTVDEPFSPAV